MRRARRRTPFRSAGWTHISKSGQVTPDGQRCPLYVTEPSWACAGQSKAAADAATKKAIAAVREAAIGALEI